MIGVGAGRGGGGLVRSVAAWVRALGLGHSPGVLDGRGGHDQLVDEVVNRRTVGRGVLGAAEKAPRRRGRRGPSASGVRLGRLGVLEVVCRRVLWLVRIFRGHSRLEGRGDLEARDRVRGRVNWAPASRKVISRRAERFRRAVARARTQGAPVRCRWSPCGLGADAGTLSRAIRPRAQGIARPSASFVSCHLTGRGFFPARRAREPRRPREQNFWHPTWSDGSRPCGREIARVLNNWRCDSTSSLNFFLCRCAHLAGHASESRMVTRQTPR